MTQERENEALRQKIAQMKQALDEARQAIDEHRQRKSEEIAELNDLKHREI